MKNESEQSSSVWNATTEPLFLTALNKNTETDICIIGAGIAGMTTAYLLAREGKSVVVLDDGAVGGGETCRTTAHLVNALDDRYYEIERLHGEKGARLAAESHTSAVNKIEEIVHKEKISCEFERVDGYLFVPPGDSPDQLEKELQAIHRAGLKDVTLVKRIPYTEYDFGSALHFPRQAQFHVLKYVNGLAEAITKMGGRIYTKTHAEKVQGGKDTKVETDNGISIKCQSVVVATNTPMNNLVVLHTKQAPYRTYVIGARIPKGSVPTILLWDTPDPYHYVRVTKGGNHDILIVGGEDHKTGQADDGAERYARLEEWSRERFPMIESIDYRWSGQVMEPIDGLAFIGRNPSDEDNIFVVSGDSGNGMTHGTIGGTLITDLIMGRKNEWAVLYEPSRISLLSADKFAKETLNFVAQYIDLVTPGDVDAVKEIGPDNAALLRRGMQKIAAYRDEKGNLHKFTAVCPHLGCIVRWNESEQTWDCPCHGSRFDKLDGHAINGPANVPLAGAK